MTRHARISRRSRKSTMTSRNWTSNVARTSRGWYYGGFLMDEFTLSLRFTAQRAGESAVPIRISRMSPDPSQVSQAYVLHLSLTRDVYFLAQTLVKQSYERLPYYQGIEIFSPFISTQIVHFTKKWRQNSTEKTTPTSSTSEARTSTSE